MTPDSAPTPVDIPSKPRRRGWIFIVLGLLCAGGVWFWKRHQAAPSAEARGGGNPAAAAAKRPTPVLVAEVTLGDVPVILEGLGTVTPIASVTVRSQVDGQLQAVKFTEGASIKRGQLLAQIDPRPFQVRLQQARATLERDRASLENAQRDLSRYEQLQKLLPEQQVDTQRTQVATLGGTIKMDEAAVADAELQLEYTRITAPIDGVAGLRTVNPGNLVHASDTTGIVTLTQLDPIAVLFTLPQDELPKVARALAQGTPRVEVSDRSGQNVLGVGKLTVLDNQVNVDTGTLKLKAELPNPDHALWPNQFVKARVMIETRKGVLSVPAAAITRGPNGEFVYVVGADNQAEQRPVLVESLEGERALIAQGLSADERVIIDGQDQVKPGAPLQPRAANPPAGRLAPDGRDPSADYRSPALRGGGQHAQRDAGAGHGKDKGKGSSP
ncbi:MAG TPA: efflux RND transporter periplasmic adaptor subunit [Polyangiales bacterium]|nr:efflux RND transporter periplasmic adaptor subunit [Polyangiales bacterium]